MSLAALVALVAAVVVGGFVALWAVSLVKRDASIVDAWWGPAFAVVAWLGAGAGAADGARPWLVAGLVSLWGVRLGLHLQRRNHGQPEDHRYAAMRAQHGERFGRVSLVTVFLLQAVLVLVIAAPLWLLARPEASAALGVLDGLAAALVLLGLSLEAIADAQLARFRRDPASRGKVLDGGLWRYSRHPNYFGDAVLWWGLGLFGVASGAWPGLIGPAIMTFLLRKVSGVTLLESTIEARRPGYAAYIARTSPFVPWWPRARPR